MSAAVTCKQQHPILFSNDIEATVAFYREALGFTVGFRMENIVGLNLDQVSIHVVAGDAKPEGAQVYFVVSDVDAYFESLQLPEAALLYPPTSQPYGLRDFALRDNQGYSLTFGSHLANAGPPLEIERSSYEVRMEKRLLAVMQDLANHKGMVLAELLEEIALHSFEPLPEGGTTSPHSEADLKEIAILKEKHGLDYEAHDAYRFKEAE